MPRQTWDYLEPLRKYQEETTLDENMNPQVIGSGNGVAWSEDDRDAVILTKIGPVPEGMKRELKVTNKAKNEVAGMGTLIHFEFTFHDSEYFHSGGESVARFVPFNPGET